MKVSYRFIKNFSKLRTAGFDLPDDALAFVVYEHDKRFETLKKLLGNDWLGNVTIIETEFSEKEKSDSDFLHIQSPKILGYPQPEEWDEEKRGKEQYPFDIYPYFEKVFEVAGTNPDYGMLRGNQIGSFSFLNEPKWGKSTIGSIFWCMDAFFTTPETFREIFEPFGISSRPVLKLKTQQPLKTVVQLIPQGTSLSKLIIKNDQIEEFADVPEWGIRKYMLTGRGFFPSFESHPGDYDFFASQEYFGPGGCTEKELFISQRLYQALKTKNIKGLKYHAQLNTNRKGSA